MKNAINYVAPKNKTTVHIMSLNDRISCVVEISIFGFKKYQQRVFDFMELNTSPTFKKFLQSKTYHAEKNKSYYQRYDVKIMRAFHNKAMMKQKMYKNMLVKRRGVDYSIGIRFQTSLINMDEAKALTKNNQLKKRIRSKEDGAGVAPSSNFE